MVDLREIAKVRVNADRLYTPDEVEQAITRLADTITRDLAEANPVLLCVLNGGIIVTGKLLPQLPFLLELDTVHASRYRGKTHGSQLRWLQKPSIPLKGRHVLLLDDVLDEGITLAAIQTFCREEGALSVKIAVLVDKQLPQPKPCRADFVGLTAPNRYIFGYGMDYKGYLRNAPGIFACKDTS
ncbi:MAG: hypoxanthine-guanine phosphoribosyltransferase [Methylothermaceae bacteria B42]|nr:MAG: hypoxanthine-guanine phosphoribosyltransferase [Methylothermaceae bacteria B42]HHJ38683.1 hypoxanthine-guanine phosphoribosyltransferase [Methylothermaceae bacterium]